MHGTSEAGRTAATVWLCGRSGGLSSTPPKLGGSRNATWERSGSHASLQRHESTAWSIPSSCTTSQRAAFSSTDALSVTWPSQNLGHSSPSQSWRRLGNRKAFVRRWVTAKSLPVSSPVSWCYTSGLVTVTDFQLLCGLMSRALGLWRCSWNRQALTSLLYSSKYFFLKERLMLLSQLVFNFCDTLLCKWDQGLAAICIVGRFVERCQLGESDNWLTTE